MTANDATDKLIPLELPLEALAWLRAFLREEILSAEIDHDNVATLHTDVAIRAAKEALNREIAQMTKVADDAREAIARRIATLSAQPPVA